MIVIGGRGAGGRGGGGRGGGGGGRGGMFMILLTRLICKPQPISVCF